MYCIWFLNIYNCDISYILIIFEKIGLAIHILLFVIGFYILYLRNKYLWKGLYKIKNGNIQFMPIETFIILSLIFFIIRIIYILCKILNITNFCIIGFLYSMGWFPGMLSYNIYYIKIINSLDIHYKILLPNKIKMIMFIKIQVILIMIFSTIFSTISGFYFIDNLKIYYILSGFSHFFIGLGVLIIGIISLFYCIQQKKILNLNFSNEVLNSISNMQKILINLSILAIPVSFIWFYIALNQNNMLQNKIFSIIIVLIWDILCAPIIISFTYLIIYLEILKKKKLITN